MNLSKKKTMAPVPPLKGSFPLDHFAECNQQFYAYDGCLKDHEGVHRFCTEEARQYLECRMEKGLMQKEDLKELGL